MHMPRGMTMANRNRTDFAIEIAASIFTLAGIYLGSTTIPGASMYLVSLVFWFWIMFRKALWGLLPLNVATWFLSLLNLLRAL